MTVIKNPHSVIYLQAHWAGAKRQQHLPKELVLQYSMSALSINQQDKRQHEPKVRRAANSGFMKARHLSKKVSFIFSGTFV